MPSLTRRNVLQAASTSAVVGLAGCSLLADSSSQPPELGSIEVLNDDDSPHTVQVLLLEDGTPVFWRSVRLAGASADASSFAEFEQQPTGPEPYVIYARLGEASPSAWRRLDVGQYSTACIGISIQVDDRDGSPYLSIWKTHNPSWCGEDPEGFEA
ncbi:hypothetical protein [Salinarchaeum chitinilyticum]